ncbi:MAG: high-potential iron-sulfur protein [Bdellovibrionales bacterium]|nr:high-potential iron-sulfur protein [Bdellovibrionales bacterium]
MEDDNTCTRRSFFQMAVTGLVAVPLVFKSTTVFGADACPAVAPKGKALGVPGEGMAKSLDYVLDAKTSKNPKYKTGSNCSNCKFYNVGKAESGHAPCTMMGMKYVSNCGWCKSYALKA